MEIIEKKCTTCSKNKSIGEFCKHPKGKYGVHSKCNECRSLKSREDYKNNPEKRRQSNYTYSKQLKRYNLTLSDYNMILEEQGYRCKICDKKAKLVVDHCHNTGKVRGLLCTKCNTGLGKFNDDIILMTNALSYLKDQIHGVSKR